jgi:peptidyl-prolyl cis-trans isomerase D
MATLQKIRSKGPLLVVVIGLALFAFIAGDAWKAIAPHQSQDAGEVNGDVLSAQDYQTLVEEYTDVLKFTTGQTALNDEQTAQIKDEVWRNYVNNQLIEKEAKKLGLKVTDAEIQSIVAEGSHPMLQQLAPFMNSQTGRFDKDMLNKFLVEYSKLDRSQMPAQYAEYYDGLYKLWAFVEKTISQTRLEEKYQALITKALLSNPVEAKESYEARVNQMDLLLAAVPYSTVADSTIVVKESELKDLYNKKKEQFKQYTETRDIKYVDIQVTASAEDRAALEAEMAEYTKQLGETNDEYTSFVRSTGSNVSYVDIFAKKSAFPSDVVARMDSAAIGSVYGPYYNMNDNTLNSFKVVAKTAAADSIEFRQIQVYNETPEKTKTLADSIYNAIKGGADFGDIAKKYGQIGEKNWIASAQYEGAQLDGDNLKYISTLNNLGVNEMTNLALGQANVILQVTNKKSTVDKYKVAVIKRTVDFSKDTYNKAYNNFSQFIAANNSLDKVVANAEEAGYKLFDRADLSSSEHTIGGVRGTKDALKWAFSAKEGEVSGLYECGDNDHMMVVAVENINREGYAPLKKVQEFLRAEVIKDKKAEKIMADMKAAGASSFAQYQSLPGAVSDSVKHVTFSAPAYVAALRSSEPMVGAYASVAETGKVSAPVKGTAGVLVMQLYAKDKLNETFDAQGEESSIQGLYERLSTRVINDLYLKANVKDLRYKFF